MFAADTNVLQPQRRHLAQFWIVFVPSLFPVGLSLICLSAIKFILLF